MYRWGVLTVGCYNSPLKVRLGESSEAEGTKWQVSVDFIFIVTVKNVLLRKTRKYQHSFEKGFKEQTVLRRCVCLTYISSLLLSPGWIMIPQISGSVIEHPAHGQRVHCRQSTGDLPENRNMFSYQPKQTFYKEKWFTEAAYTPAKSLQQDCLIQLINKKVREEKTVNHINRCVVLTSQVTAIWVLGDACGPRVSGSGLMRPILMRRVFTSFSKKL